jgi:E3 ubiquitin-protein ligase TRIP12
VQAAYQSGEDEVGLATMGRSYVVDFNTMQQINEDSGTVRPVQRKAAPAASATANSTAGAL